jgi:outer membrane lipoprotein SlyB
MQEPYRPVAQPQPIAQAPAPVYAPQPMAQARCYDCGEVAAVNAIEQKGEGSWIGPVAGGVGGAILGKQMGKGSGNTIMTILGAAGGAYAGHKVEQKVRTTTRWDVVVRMEDGSTRTVSAAEQPLWRVGDRVRVNNGTLEPQQRS